jgi:hypothetical protein
MIEPATNIHQKCREAELSIVLFVTTGNGSRAPYILRNLRARYKAMSFNLLAPEFYI